MSKKNYKSDRPKTSFGGSDFSMLSGFKVASGQNDNSGSDRHAGNGSGNRQSGRNTNTCYGSYVGAPYNFVPFPSRVYKYPEENLPAHNSVSEDLHTGEITCEVEAKTPIIIDSGSAMEGTRVHSFYKDEYGRYAIPGSTMRGLIRSNVQVLGLSGFSDDVDDYSLMYREIAAGADRQRYNNILGQKLIPIKTDKGETDTVTVLTNVRAGYIENRNGHYCIWQTKVDRIRESYGDMNYYVLSEKYILRDWEDAADASEDYNTLISRLSYPVFFNSQKPDRGILQNLPVKGGSFNKKTVRDKNGKEVAHYVPKRKNIDYIPYYIPVSYAVSHEKDIDAVKNPGELANSGYAMSSGYMNEKKSIYIIPEIDKTKESIDIPDKDVKAFRADYEKRKNTLKGLYRGRDDRTRETVLRYFNLPEPGEGPKPVFYVELEGRLYFGFTPRLRLFYDYTIRDGLSEEQKETFLDYNKAMFGYTGDTKSYRTRISFSDMPAEGNVTPKPEQKMVLGQPGPTSYLNYVMQKEDSKKISNYNTENFRLRGMKQYWLHRDITELGLGNGNENVMSRFKPLPAGTKFKGEIRFQNLTSDELGLLLWSIQLEPDSWMNVGKAKAYGFGAVKVKILNAYEFPRKLAYNLDFLDPDPKEEIDIPKMIRIYKDTINAYLAKSGKKAMTIEKVPSVVSLLRMKDSNRMADPGDIRFMSLDEYKEQKKSGKGLPMATKV